MKAFTRSLVYGCLLCSLSLAATIPQRRQSGPTIRFAPTGDNRLRLPKDPLPVTGIFQATNYGPDCIQSDGGSTTSTALSRVSSDTAEQLNSTILATAAAASEDCLSINVIRPSGVPAGTTLPVLVWIFGGGFQVGSTASYNGAPTVARSVATSQPIIYVSMNYRVGALGWLPGAEVKAAGVGNLGLHDQTLALQWIQKHISKFGGDPSKVTIWGESAGAISVALQMLRNGGDNEGLFRGAVMNSGAPTPTGDLSNGQPIYDQIANAAGCSQGVDSLACLRALPLDEFQAAANTAPGLVSDKGLNLPFLPRSDGVFLTAPPQQLVVEGKYSKVPIITGCNDDEGTLFSLGLNKITTDTQTRDWLFSNFASSGNATQAEVNIIADKYPSDVRQGSPYDTGFSNAIFPQYKRLSSIQGDLVFQAPRRLFLNYTSATQPSWSFLNKRLKGTLVVGSYHGSDLIPYYTDPAPSDVSRQGQDYLINFVNTLDPNGVNLSGKLIYWPKYNNSNKTLLQYTDSSQSNSNGISLVQDTYRKDQMDYLNKFSLLYPS